LLILLTPGCFLVPSVPGRATDRTWTGVSGIDKNWMTPGNWQGGVAPSPGDNLIFPSGTGSNLTNHNNFPDGTTFGKITLSPGPGQDYTIGGNRVILTNGMAESVAGLSSFVYFNITLGANQTFTASKLLVFNNVIDLQTYQLIVNNTANVTFNGTLNIAPGNTIGQTSLIKTNTGTLTFSSTATISSTNSPQVYLAQGTLVMSGVSSNVDFTLGLGSMVLDGVVDDPASFDVVTIGGPGSSLSGTGTAGRITVDQNAQQSSCVPGDSGAPGVLKCGSFNCSAVLANTLQIKVNGTTPGTGYSQLLINGSYNLGGSLLLALQWGYTPQIGDSFLVITQASGARYFIQANGFFAGQLPNSVFDSTNGSSQGVSYNSNGVALTTIRTSTSPFSLWKGVASQNPAFPYGFRNWSVTANWAQGIAPTNGSSVMFSPYQAVSYDSSGDPIPVPPVTNDLVSGTSLVSLLFSGSNYVVYGNAVTLTGGITNSAGGGTNFCNLDLASVGPLMLDVEPAGTLALSGKFAGSGTLRKEGGGTLQYAGTTMNSFVGTVVVDGGTLQVNGSFTDGSFTVNGGLLGGTGSVSAVTMSGGTLEPGDGLGVLQIQGDLSMAPGAVFEIELNGPIPGSGYGQVQVNGGVNLNGATLNLQPGFAATPGAAFLILVNDGTDAVVGTFAGLAEGAVFSAGGQVFTISYRGGSGGNDVVVTRVNAPPSHFTNIGFVSPNVVQLRGSGLSNVNYGIQANTNLLSTNWVNIGVAPADGSGNFFFDASNSTSFPLRFFRLVSP
jgi:hypothetical protein